MYEESLRVPLLVRYPKIIKPGSITTDFAINTDLAPTFLDLAGVDIPEDMDGVSFKPVLEGNTPDDADSVDGWIEIRTKRDQILRETDWTMTTGATVDQAQWAAYRQVIRDIPQT